MWKGGTAAPNAGAPGLVPKALKLGKAEQGGAGPGDGTGVTPGVTRPQRPPCSLTMALPALPEPLELTRESSEGRNWGRAGEGVAPDVGQEVGAGLSGRLGRALGSWAGLGGHHKVSWVPSPRHPQARSGLTCGSVPVSPRRGWGDPGSAVLLWEGFTCSGATYLPWGGQNID